MGKQDVCLDGLIIPSDAQGIRFEGWHSEHDLDFVPQVAAIEDESVLEEVLGNPEYWRMRAVERDET